VLQFVPIVFMTTVNLKRIDRFSFFLKQMVVAHWAQLFTTFLQLMWCYTDSKWLYTIRMINEGFGFLHTFRFYLKFGSLQSKF